MPRSAALKMGAVGICPAGMLRERVKAPLVLQVAIGPVGLLGSCTIWRQLPSQILVSNCGCTLREPYLPRPNVQRGRSVSKSFCMLITVGTNHGEHPIEQQFPSFWHWRIHSKRSASTPLGDESFAWVRDGNRMMLLVPSVPE